MLSKPVLGARMRSEVGHDGLDEGADDANDPDGGVRVHLQGLGIKGAALESIQWISFGRDLGIKLINV
jgi:hypothetical protein